MTLYTISRPPRAFSLVKHKVVTSRGSCCIYCGGLFRGTELNQRSLMSLVSWVLIPCLWRTMNDLLTYIRDCLSSGNHAEQYVAKTGKTVPLRLISFFLFVILAHKISLVTTILSDRVSNLKRRLRVFQLILE